MSTFDLHIPGSPPLVLDVLRGCIDGWDGATTTATHFEIPLGVLEGTRFDRFHARGRFLPDADGVRLVGEFDLTGATKAAYVVGLVLVLVLSAWQLLPEGRWIAWILGAALGGGTIAVLVRFVRGKLPDQGQRKLRILLNEVQTRVDLLGAPQDTDLAPGLVPDVRGP